MRVVRTTLLSMVLVFGAAFLTEVSAQQTGTVTGQVTDESTGQPLTGVQMQVVGTNVGGLTDQQGRYLLTRVPAGTQEIRAVIIGYAQETETVTVPGGGTATANFALRTSAVALEAVVVSAATGRQQRARELGAAVSNIEVEDLNPGPITSLSDAIGGRSEGLVLQDASGTTGTGQRIRIRGANSLSLSNEPLIYVDGVQIGTDFGAFGVGGQEASRVNDINPNDIASVEIIKGPAAASLYGTAAANGVILITTKRGRPGNTQWNAWVETGTIEDRTDYPANYLSYELNDPDAPLFRSNGLFNSYHPDFRPNGHFYCPNYAAAAPEDPEDPIGHARAGCTQQTTLAFNTLRDPRTTPFVTGYRQRVGASVRGGTEDVRFFVSGQMEEEQGVIEFNTQDKANVRANLDARLAPTVDLSVSFGYADAALGLNNNDNSIFSPLINGLTAPAYFVPPDTTREYGAPVNDLNYGWGFSQEELENLVTFNDVDRYTTSTNLRWRPMSWLTLNATGGLDLTTAHDYETLQPDRLPIAASYAAGYRASQRTNDYLYTGNASAVGTFDLMSDLLSTTTVGVSYNRDYEVNTYCYGSALVPGTASCGTTSNLFNIDEDFFEVKTVGAYVAQELGWRDRVFVAAALRGDDNSAFGTDFGLAYYPSASVSWVVGEEPWFPELGFMSTLRLRSAWGVSGLRPGFRDAVTLFDPSTVATRSGDVPGVTLDVTGNVALKPERTTEWELGFDTGLFADRLAVEFTYYNKESEDALIERPLPGSLGLTDEVFDNLGSIQNKGTELGLNLMVFESRNFGMNVGFNNTTIKNEIIELGLEDPITFDPQRHVEGYSAGGFWAPVVTWDDANNDGLLAQSEIQVDSVDTFIGPSIPTWQRSFFADVRLFDFLTVSTMFEGRGGNYQENFTESFRCSRNSQAFGCGPVANPDASLASQAAYLAARQGDEDEDVSSYGFVEAADFWKWRELAVVLSTPNAWGQRFERLDGLRLTLSGRNLATFTDYTGIDPEAVSNGDANFSQYEFNTQPPVRYLMLRLDYTF